MDREFQTRLLHDLVKRNWGKNSISVHNRITDIRTLLTLLGDEYLMLDPIAVEIETISGTALGMGVEVLPERDFALLSEHVMQLRKRLDSMGPTV